MGWADDLADLVEQGDREDRQRREHEARVAAMRARNREDTADALALLPGAIEAVGIQPDRSWPIESFHRQPLELPLRCTVITYLSRSSAHSHRFPAVCHPDWSIKGSYKRRLSDYGHFIEFLILKDGSFSRASFKDSDLSLTGVEPSNRSILAISRPHEMQLERLDASQAAAQFFEWYDSRRSDRGVEVSVQVNSWDQEWITLDCYMQSLLMDIRTRYVQPRI